MILGAYLFSSVRGRYSCPIRFSSLSMTASASAPAASDTVAQRASQLPYSFIGSKLNLNNRTLKARLAQPWLFTGSELYRLAQLLACEPGELLELAIAQSKLEGDLAPGYVPVPSRAGRKKITS